MNRHSYLWIGLSAVVGAGLGVVIPGLAVGFGIAIGMAVGIALSVEQGSCRRRAAAAHDEDASTGSS